jgi:hypothetical protein
MFDPFLEEDGGCRAGVAGWRKRPDVLNLRGLVTMIPSSHV